MSIQSKKSQRNCLKMVVLSAISVMLFYAGYASAAADIGTVANNLKSTMGAIAGFITALSYVVGIGFGVSAMLKFKAHKDNPQSTPLGTPMMLLFVAAGLIFLPSLFGLAGASLFGSGASVGNVSGFTSF